MPTTLDAQFLKTLTAQLSNDILSTDPADCYSYGYDNSCQHVMPEAVVLATQVDQIQACVQLCNEYKVPLTARGRGTGTTGGSVPLQHGLVLSTERMDNIIEIDPVNRYAVVEPGVLNQSLQDSVAKQGYFWPPDPTSASFCTIGGNLAVNAAGPRAVKYGSTRDNVLGLNAITGTGKKIQTGVYTTKGVVGYDLTRLLIGSEGTLVVITQATLKLTPIPEARATLQATFKNIESATEAIVAIMSQPITPYALEFMDAGSIKMIRDYTSIKFSADTQAMLMIEVDGSTASLDVSVKTIAGCTQNSGLIEFRHARTDEEVAALWKTRKALSPALRKLAPKKINEDVVVPVSNIPALIHALEHISEQFGIPIVNFGHAGNGNIHVNLLIDLDDPTQAGNAEDCLDAVFEKVLQLKGTLSGEHGVGISKRDFVDREIEQDTLALMQQLKHQFDPNNILNPGKMFPAG